jgi:preprotein translocase subunit YajC
MAKKSLPPAFLANIKKAKAAGGIGTGTRVVDPKGNKGTVTKVAAGTVTVKHDNGTVDKHPVAKVKKTAAPKKGK